MMNLLSNASIPFPFGLKGIEVLAVSQGEGSLTIRLQKALPFGLCPLCGTISQKVNDRHIHPVTDRPLDGPQVKLEVLKRRWKCLNTFCSVNTFTEQIEGLARKRTHTDLFCRYVYQLSRKMTFSDVHTHLQEVYGCQSALSTVYRAAVEQLHQQVTVSERFHTPFVGLDEFAKGKGHDYGVVLVDLVHRKVLDIDEGGKTKKAAARLLSKVESEGLKACAIDMWEPFKRACRQVVPHALVVADHFHVVKTMNKAVDAVRKRARGHLESKDKKKALFTYKNLILMGLETLSSKQEHRLWEILSWDKDLCRAYELKELLRAIYEGEIPETATIELDNWIREAQASGIPEVQEVAGTFVRWKPEILNFWIYRINNAVTEGKINKIKTIRRWAYNYNNFEHLRLKILDRE
jgi:transposase